MLSAIQNFCPPLLHRPSNPSDQAADLPTNAASDLPTNAASDLATNAASDLATNPTTELDASAATELHGNTTCSSPTALGAPCLSARRRQCALIPFA
jgi:hypothetical protein